MHVDGSESCWELRHTLLQAVDFFALIFFFFIRDPSQVQNSKAYPRKLNLNKRQVIALVDDSLPKAYFRFSTSQTPLTPQLAQRVIHHASQPFVTENRMMTLALQLWKELHRRGENWHSKDRTADMSQAFITILTAGSGVRRPRRDPNFQVPDAGRQLVGPGNHRSPSA